MRNNQVEIVGIESRLSAQSQQEPLITLDFQSQEFTASTERAKCIAGHCWQIIVYDENSLMQTTAVVERFETKLSQALQALPDMLFGTPPFVLKIYLVPPSRQFDDMYKVTDVSQRNFGIAIHLDGELPLSRRQQRAFDEREAMAVAAVIHEFIHFASLQNDLYENPWALSAAAHMEALAKCYENWSFLTTLDEDSKVQHSILFDPLAQTKPDRHELAQAHGRATEYLAHKIKQSFAAMASPTLFANQTLLSASNTQEQRLLLNICRDLSQIREL